MKVNLLKSATWAMVLCASMTGFTACDDDDEAAPATEQAPEVLSGAVTSDKVLEAGKSYTLSGALLVKAPATLKIEKGVTITANNDGQVDYILIEQGAKIDAQGTAEEPIVMTAENKEPSAWGGLHICGYAPINTSSGEGKSEIGDATYGGNNPADNSGVLRYVRLEYTGFAFNEEQESNGISFYGVGNGTQVSYVQAYKGSDDGLEFFGGTVNIDHCVVVDCTDDSYDWTEGWCGNGSYLVAYQSDPTCDCLIEADNNGSNAAANPVSHPILSNLTLVGNNNTGEQNRGVRLRAGTQVELSNAQITGKPNALTVETVETETALAEGISKLTNVAISGELSSKEGIYTNDQFVAAGNLTNQTFSFTDGYVGMDGGRGAVEASNMWMSGWTK